jgi:hypothetical protein
MAGELAPTRAAGEAGQSATAAAGWPALTPFERRLLDQARQEAAVLLLRRTGTRVDTGLWFRQARLWLACLPDRLVLFAFGPRPFCETLPLANCGGSLYNHVTGELVLAEAGAMVARRTVRLPPEDGHLVLAQIRAKERS